MKNLTLLLIILPCLALSQTYVRLSAGASTNTRPDFPGRYKSMISPAAGLSLLHNITPGFQLGVGVGFLQMRTSTTITLTTNGIEPDGQTKLILNYAKAGIPVTAEANYTAGNFFCGANAGALFSTGYQPEDVSQLTKPYPRKHYIDIPNGVGFTGGLQTGYNYKIGNGWTLGGTLKANVFLGDYTIFYFPASLSGSYNLRPAKKAPAGAR